MGSLKREFWAGVLAVVAGVPGLAEAKTYTYCSSGTTSSGESGCFYNKMPLLSQNSSSLTAYFPGGDPSESKLCVPTAATMGLAAITMDGLSYYTSSWTGTDFVNLPYSTRIVNFMDLMDTTVSGGTTGGNIGKYPDRADDIVAATESTHKASSVLIGDTRLKDDIARHQVDILTYGHYTEDCTNSFLGSTYCDYDRDGGHEVAVNGYYSTSTGGLRTRHYDPWYAVVKHRNIQSLVNSKAKFPYFNIDTRPYGSNTTYVYRSNSAVKIIDRADGINTNAQ